MSLGTGRPAQKAGSTNLIVGIIIAITLALMVFVFIMSAKATETVQVCMLTQNVYKNQMITSSMVEPYDMIKAEFEKYAITQQNGTTKRRIVLWEEKDSLVGMYAAYSLKANTYCEYADYINSRTDNSDTVLYSYPGKEIVAFDIGSSDLNVFKTYLQTGDRINIEGIYSESTRVKISNGDGTYTNETVETYKTETVFQDIVIADMLNSSNDSILDLYAEYDSYSTYKQAQLDVDADWQASVTPSKLLVALTPEEKDRYYYYTSKSGIEFKVSLPQRAS